MADATPAAFALESDVLQLQGSLNTFFILWAGTMIFFMQASAWGGCSSPHVSLTVHAARFQQHRRFQPLLHICTQRSHDLHRSRTLALTHPPTNRRVLRCSRPATCG